MKSNLSKWHSMKLKDLITLKRGYDLPQKERSLGAYPIMSSSGINGYHNIAKVKGPGVVTGRSGQLGKIHYTEKDFWPLNTTLYVQDFKSNDPYFVYYFLHTLHLENYNAGSSVPTLNRNHVHSLDVTVPEVEIQKNIGAVFRRLDEKIELNNQIIANLEELTQSLFKHWFVDFEFPNEEGEPYYSSGGKMIDSECGLIPEGWELKKLNEITAHSKKSFNPQKTELKEVFHYSLPAFDSEKYPTTEKVENIKSNKYFISKYSVMFSKMNPTTPRIWLPNISGEKNVCSTEFIVLNSQDLYRRSFVYELCKSNSFHGYLTSNTTGSTNSRQRVSPETALSYSLPWHSTTADLFGEKVLSKHQLILELREENRKLVDLRNTLLPKLLSGEIEINEEREVEANVTLQ